MENNNEILAVKTKQWLSEWDTVNYDQKYRKKPEPHFYIFSIKASTLKKLSEIHRRKADKPRTDDTNIQRGHTEERSDEIREYVHGGFPWSTITKKQRSSPDFESLKMPGFLPTAIIANILGPETVRNNKKIDDNELIKIREESGTLTKILLPDKLNDRDWNPEVYPIEIIDGQHRLWAFDGIEQFDGDYELPVVAYYNLDITWQAYLFYTINIKPKKINTSLAYDLYPLLRNQEWLEKSKEGLMVYRETRAQELTEALWSYENSPWKGRINMLGESGGPQIITYLHFLLLQDLFYY